MLLDLVRGERAKLFKHHYDRTHSKRVTAADFKMVVVFAVVVFLVDALMVLTFLVEAFCDGIYSQKATCVGEIYNAGTRAGNISGECNSWRSYFW
jgi:hypothetical protein